MVRWCRNLQVVIRHIGSQLEHKPIKISNSFSTSGGHCFIPAQGIHLGTRFGLYNRSSNGPLHQYFQYSGIYTSKVLLAGADTSLTPISSPLTPSLPTVDGHSETTTSLLKPNKVQAILKKIRQSPKKVNLVASLVRGMRVEDALLQLQVTVKRAAKTVYTVIKSARANASHNHGLDPDRLIVDEAFVGKGSYLKRLSYHAKGRCGIMVRPHCRLTVVVREITPEEEAKIAKLRVMNYKKLTRKERQLVPHQLIETTPRWSRRKKANTPES